MKKIFKALDGTEFESKVECKNHDTKLKSLKIVVINALKSGIFNLMKYPEPKRELPLLDNTRTKADDYRFNCGDGFSGFKVYDRYGYKIFIVFKLKGRRLKILKYSYDECETWIDYVGSIFLNKL